MYACKDIYIYINHTRFYAQLKIKTAPHGICMRATQYIYINIYICIYTCKSHLTSDPLAQSDNTQYKHTHTHIYTNMYIYTYIYTYISIFKFPYQYICIYTNPKRLQTHWHVQTIPHVKMYIYIYINIYVYIHINPHINIYIYNSLPTSVPLAPSDNTSFTHMFSNI